MRRHFFRLSISCIMVLITAGIFATRFSIPDSGKRMLEFGWNTPRLQAMPEYIEAAQNTPFDGLILDIETPLHEAGLSWTIYTNTRIDAEPLEILAQDMKDFPWGKLTDNFLRVNIAPGEVDWFDDYDAILFNLEAVARLAHELGFKGIMLDTEQYPGISLFYYPQQKYQDRYNFDEYAAQSRQRGREVMQTLNQAYPSITVLYAYGLAVAPYENMEDLHEHPYGLLPPFIEGMMEIADEETVLIDGFEQSYTYRQNEQFRSAFEFVKGYPFEEQRGEEQNEVSSLDIGFGLWVDHRCDNGDPNTTCLGFNPSEFQQAVQLALTYTDRYVWIYSQRFNWYTGEGIPEDWRESLAQLRD